MIVIGYTADRFGRAALEHGVAEARLRNTSVLVINSTAGDSYTDSTFASPDQLADVRTVLGEADVEFEVQQPVGVDAATELLKAMDRHDAELLVIGIKDRNPVGKLLLGSVSQQVLLESPKPVLAVKPAE
ncbi:universal stress protein [Mycolicibacterium sediminis]|uniref:Universal stress protein n=1 Tax=Mycolicibacterium sediminis TaxID=1286180 RepID=A0A7I7QVY5_9MYCO|nr:universal stress protein [Mycolicibacterium sediminis]BBY30513.1 universal stress protein [Mycolicibacterium sediminis]